jgi:uncharacterized metal-binding protein YceD (DUF177 family)
MSASFTFSHPLRSATLSARKPTRFHLRPDPDQRRGIAEALGLLDLPVFTFKGELRPVGQRDFLLEAELVARAVQPCSVTLAPVPIDLAETVRRTYVADWQEPEGDEVEMPSDETMEPLPDVIDLAAVAVEALELALPLYPRAPGVSLGEAVFAGPGTEPLRDADLKPFAGLAALKDRLPGKGDAS